MFQAILYVGALVIGIWIGPDAQSLASAEKQAYCEARPQDCSSGDVYYTTTPVFQDPGGY